MVVWDFVGVSPWNRRVLDVHLSGKLSEIGKVSQDHTISTQLRQPNRPKTLSNRQNRQSHHVFARRPFPFAVHELGRNLSQDWSFGKNGRGKQEPTPIGTEWNDP